MSTGRLFPTESLDTVIAPHSFWAEFVVDINRLHDRNGEKSVGPRSPYMAPKLKVFGPVGALTQAGTGFNSEVMMNNISNSPNQQRP
jgi:hypothetical protein